MDDQTARAGACEQVTPLAPASAEAGAVSDAIVRVARLHRILAGHLLRRVGLHPSQELVMMRLWDEGPQRQTDLAQLLGADSATMTRTIQRLEHGGFVRRVPSTTDKRVTIVEPTTASLAIRADVEQAWTDLEHGVAGDLDPTERQNALALLARMEASLDAVIEQNRTTRD